MPFRIPEFVEDVRVRFADPTARELLEYIAWLTHELALVELRLKQIEGTTADGIPE